MSAEEVIMAKEFHQAPLPFVGQKRFFLKHFISVLNNNIPDDGAGWTIVDVFGGSGLLAHNAKQCKPAATVIYNDFDGYRERLKHIDDTNRLRQGLSELTANIPRHHRFSDEKKAELINYIRSFDGFIDVHALRTWLMFGARQENTIKEILENNSMYNCIRKSDYRYPTGYLDNVEVTSQSYESLMPEYFNQPKTLLILDPPYLSTSQGAYNKSEYFGMIKFLKLMQFVRPPFIFFSSTRSELLQYLDYIIEGKLEHYHRFTNYQLINITAHISNKVNYEDNMIYKF